MDPPNDILPIATAELIARARARALWRGADLFPRDKFVNENKSRNAILAPHERVSLNSRANCSANSSLTEENISQRARSVESVLTDS